MPRAPANFAVLPAVSATAADAVVALSDAVQSKLVEICGESVILDRDVAALYGVETRVVNQAVRNNPAKFPKGYVLSPTPGELGGLRSKILTANPMSRVLPKAFTERGLYMLATILKSPRATAATLAIVETFAKVRGFGKIKHTVKRIKKR